MQALVALHGLWLLALVGLARWLGSKWPPERVKVLGIVLCVIGLAGLGGLIAHDMLTWYPAGSSINRRYVIQRALYIVGSTPDIPVLETMVIGVSLWVSAWWSSRQRHAEPHEPDHERRSSAGREPEK